MTTALYRRYRPDTFTEVIGQEHVTAPLMQALSTDRVTHAYLFSGPRGCGKTTSARILARCLNCAQGPTAHPCGECDSCVELARGGPGSLDVVEIDAASHGGVDDARDLRERATFAPARDRFKIFILDEAHMVTSQGFNALLKIVEEPPPHVKFIFATTEPDKVIGTIRSRTHHYPFRLVGPTTLLPYLEQLCAAEGVPVGAGVLPLVVRAGGGSVRDSLSVLDQLVAGADATGIDYERAVALLGYTHATLLDDVVEAIAARDGASAFRVVERVISSGHEPRRFVEDLLERLRDLIVIAASGESAQSVLRDLPEDQLERMRAQASLLGGAELSRSADLANAALTEMTGATSPRLHLELLVARLLLPAADDGALGHGARLDRVERHLSAGTTPAGAPAERSAAAGAASRPAATAPSAPATPAAATVAPEPAAAAPATPARTGAAGADAAPAEATSTSMSTNAEPTDAEPSDAESSPTAARSTSRAVPQSPPAARPPADDDEATEPAVPRGAADDAGDAPARGEGTDSPPESPVETRADDADAPVADGAAAVAHPPVPRPAPAASGPASAEPAAGLDAEMVRRRWPEVLQTLRGLRMATWVLVSQNAQVGEVTAQTVALAFTTPQLATTFRTGPHPENVQRALHETLGLQVRVETTLAAAAGDAGAGGAPHGEAAAQAAPPAAAGSASGSASLARTAAEASWADPAPTPSAPRAADARAGGQGRGPGADAAAQRSAAGRDPGAAEGRRPAQAAGSSGAAGRRPTTDPASDGIPDGPEPSDDPEPAGPAAAPASARTPHHAGAPSGPVASRPMGTAAVSPRAAAVAAAAAAPAPARPDDDGADADPDDPDLAASGLVGAPLVAQMLGGTVIDEIPEDL